MNERPAKRNKFPPWLRKRVPASGMIQEVRDLLKDLKLATVCQSARCPNLCECFAEGTATFMILGNTCTRDCRFCAIPHGECAPPDPDEPARLAEAAAKLKLRHVVVTSVTRDDLPDGGAEQFRKTILALRSRLDCRVEVLTPDFQGNPQSIDCVASGRPDIYNHNVETVPRLYPIARPAADYQRSIELLKRVTRGFSEMATKCGIMVGLGETSDEVLDVLRDLRRVGCDMVTIGQYLRPTPAHLPVARFITPEEFSDLDRRAREMGLVAVASGPFVRSSYHAGELHAAAHARGRGGTPLLRTME